MAGQHRLLNQQAALSIGIMLRDYDNDQLVGLSQLTLDGQEMDAYGIQYIAQALRRNRQLKSLSMRSCKIDAKSCHLLGEALKYNQHLQQLDLACNPLCQPQLEGINQLAQALNINLSLKSLCLAETNLSTEAMIVLAESLPQNKSLVRLDVAGNHAIQMAGFMALAASLQMNSTITYVDVHTLDNDHDMMMLHHQMLAKCTQNAQSKQQNSIQPPVQAVARLTLEERLAAAVTRGKTMPKEVAEDNTKKQKAEKDEEEQWIQQAITYTESLEQSDRAALDQSKRFQQFLCTKIPQLPDTSPHLELLLTVNDRLTTAIEQFKEKTEPLNETVSATFEIGDDDDDFDEKNDRLKELRDEFEAEEGAAFLKAKKQT
ncbi:hypothetical protein EDC96DRAFT_37899 [Choanephora cucurbitarum]|nr:hypothetical protein EDC96DRAFT_37899 [Choanephora cucurbitarum]